MVNNLSRHTRPFLLVGLLLLVSVVYGQEKTYFEWIQMEDGEQLGHVFDIFEDHTGFIWFCTNRGLIKYDGYDFQFYLYDKEDDTTPTSSWSYSGLCDSKGRIWVGTSNGLNMLQPKTEVFQRFYHDPEDSTSLTGTRIRDVFEDADGRIWIGSYDGICYYDEVTGRFVSINAPGFEGHRHGANFFQDRAGRIWVTATEGLYRIDVPQKTARQVLPKGDKNIPNLAYLTVRCQNNIDGTLMVSTSEGVWIFDPDQGTYQQLQLPPDLINKSYSQMIEYPKGTLVIGSFDVGLISWDLGEKKLLDRFSKKGANAGGPTVNSVYSLFNDSRGNLWIGLFHGANKINLSVDHFKVYQNVDHDNDLRNYTLIVYGDSTGGVWSNTMRGIYYRPNLEAEAIPVYGKSIEQGQYCRVGNFSMDQAKKTWFGISRKGVFQFDPRTQKVSIADGLTNMPTSSYIRVYCDKEDPDIIWITCDLGLCRYDQRKKQSIWYPPQKDLPDLENNTLEIAEQLGTQQLITVSNSNLLVFDKEARSFSRHPVPLTKTATSKNIVALVDDGASIWAATGNSLYNFQPDHERFQIITPEQGLGQGTILSLQRDGKGNFWFGQNGITKFDPRTNSHQNFNISHRAEALIFGSSGKSAAGHLLFPSVDGILAFKPDYIVFDTVSPKVVIRRVKINNELAKTNQLYDHVDSLTLTWDDKIITFEYAGLKFNKAKGLQYKIKLEGFDEDWRSVGNKRDATYTNLDPGSYRFQVVAANADGYWSKEAATLSILILPPYWKTTWFFFLCLLLLSGILFGVIRNYLYSLRLSREKEIAEQNTRYKSLFLANMSHEIRTPMNTIVGMNELMLDTKMTSRQQEFASIIDQSSRNLLVIVNDILDHAKIESGKYTFVASPFKISDVVDQLSSELAPRALEKDLNFEVRMDTVPTFLNGDTVRLKQILTNLLTNAIKFTDEGTVTLEVKVLASSAKEVTLRLEVRDTGFGISEDRKQLVFESFERELHRGIKIIPGAGLGLSIAKNLVEQQGGRIWFESPRDLQGVSFFVRLTYPVVHDWKPAASPKPNRIISSHKFNFLVVEDSVFNQMLLRELLLAKFPNAVVDVADNGEQAVTQVIAKTYDLVFMDIKMPVMDGFEATRRIRSLATTTKKKTTILAVTASAVSSEMEEYERAGMDGAISKPIQSAELYVIIEDILKDQL